MTRIRNKTAVKGKLDERDQGWGRQRMLCVCWSKMDDGSEGGQMGNMINS